MKPLNPISERRVLTNCLAIYLENKLFAPYPRSVRNYRWLTVNTAESTIILRVTYTDASS